QDLEKARADREAAERRRRDATAEADRQKELAGQTRTEVKRLKLAAEEEHEKVKKAVAVAMAAEDRARRTVYAAAMQLARAAWQTMSVPRLVGLLDRHRSARKDRDLRGFEWHYMRRLAHGDRLTVRWRTERGKPGDLDNLVFLAVSRDGKTFATA